jgi:hypothetical protein
MDPTTPGGDGDDRVASLVIASGVSGDGSSYNKYAFLACQAAAELDEVSGAKSRHSTLHTCGISSVDPQPPC